MLKARFSARKLSQRPKGAVRKHSNAVSKEQGKGRPLMVYGDGSQARQENIKETFK
jgi:hypothetical protein